MNDPMCPEPAPERRPFVLPEIVRHDRLPEVTGFSIGDDDDGP